MGANGVKNMLDLSTAHMPYNPEQQRRYEVVYDENNLAHILDRITCIEGGSWGDVGNCTRRCEELNQEFGEGFWGELRVAKHEHGYVVFVPSGLVRYEFADFVPEWAKPLVRRALDLDCVLVNFDQDAEQVEGLPTWEW